MGFSAYKNTKVLFAISDQNRQGKSEILHCINGIRFISITWVLLGHVIGNLSNDPANNFLPYLFKVISHFFVSKYLKIIFGDLYHIFLKFLNPSPLK